MPKFYEVNTDTEVLCYIPSGKVTTEDDEQEAQFGQDGDTCWFHSTKRLAKATGYRFDDPTRLQQYELISTFRKTQSYLDAIVLIAASLIAENCPRERTEQHARACILTQTGLVAAHRANFKLAQKAMPYVTGEQRGLVRQLKSLESDIRAVCEYVERYRKYHPEATKVHDKSEIEAIANWLKARNPYQSQLLDCACRTADALSELGSVEFTQDWSQEPRQLVQLINLPTKPDLVFTERPSVIVLGAGPESTRPAPELTVQQKQARRKLALTEFNQKIRRETLAVFQMNATTFSNPVELMEILKTQGPLLLPGFYGSSYYKADAHPLRNEDGNIQTMGTRQLHGWNRGEADDLNFSTNTQLHQIIVIGIKYNSENPIRSHVIFIDPNDHSFPGEQRKPT